MAMTCDWRDRAACLGICTELFFPCDARSHSASERIKEVRLMSRV